MIAGARPGLIFCGIERSHGFGCWKGYGHAILVADPRHAVWLRLQPAGDITKVICKAREALAEPAAAFLRVGVADCHCRGHIRSERTPDAHVNSRSTGL